MTVAPKYQRMAFVFIDDSKKDHRVYDALFIKERVPTWFTGCSATILKVIEKQKIPVNKYFFASLSKLGYRECSAEYKSRKLLIDADWVEKNVPSFGNTASPPPIPRPAKIYPPVPPYIALKADEKFTNEQGERLDIEVRGERHFDKIWFKARDVEVMLQLEDISKIMNSTSSYDQGLHYQTFDLISDKKIRGEGDQKDKSELALFLSYWGLVKMLFSRRHPIAVHFQRWAIEKLFTIQLGSFNDKEALAADVLGVTPKTLKCVLNTNVNSMPVVYLFTLGTVKDLRDVLNIPGIFKDDDIIVKYGLTQDFKRRTSEHECTFNKVKNVSLNLKYHVYIDPFYLSNAESDIEKYFIGARWHLQHAKHTELAAIPEHMLNSIVQLEYRRLGTSYAGKLADLQMQLANEAKINQQLKAQLDSQDTYTKTILLERDVRMKEREEALREKIEEQKERIKEREEMIRDQKEMMKQRLREKDEAMDMYRRFVERLTPNNS